jgi:5-methylcytosine-specific restriction endonuclease McrA
MPPKKRRKQPSRVSGPRHARNKAYGRRYRQNRAKVLGQSRVCALRLPGCTHWATETDHVIEAGLGGLSTVENLQPACVHCNRVKQQARKAKQMDADQYARMAPVRAYEDALRQKSGAGVQVSVPPASETEEWAE